MCRGFIGGDGCWTRTLSGGFCGCVTIGGGFYGCVTTCGGFYGCVTMGGAFFGHVITDGGFDCVRGGLSFLPHFFGFLHASTFKKKLKKLHKL